MDLLLPIDYRRIVKWLKNDVFPSYIYNYLRDPVDVTEACHLQGTKGSVIKASLVCLSRACLGIMMMFCIVQNDDGLYSTKWRKKGRFFSQSYLAGRVGVCRDEIVRDRVVVHVVDEVINPAVNAAGRRTAHLQLGARGLERKRRVRVPAPGDQYIYRCHFYVSETDPPVTPGANPSERFGWHVEYCG